MSSDLEKARRTPLFNSACLTELLWAPRSRKSIDRIVVLLQEEPLFNKRSKYNPFESITQYRQYLNRRQLLSRAFKGQIRLLELQREHHWDRNTLFMATALLDDPYPFVLHFAGFMAVIENQGTKEQIDEWIPRCERMEITGKNKISALLTCRLLCSN
jgi:acyl-CoA oxidase